MEQHRRVVVIPLPIVHTDDRRSIAEAELPVSFTVARVNAIVCTDEVVSGMVLGRHFHTKTTEWFILARGGFARLVAGVGAEEQVIESLRAPCLIECPAGTPHTFMSPEPGTVLITLADRAYDPADTVSIPPP